VIDKVLKLRVRIAAPGGRKAKGSTSGKTESAHVSVSGCPAATTVLSATLSQQSFTQRRAVTASVTLTNTSKSSCGASAQSPPMSNQFSLGPCGTLPLGVVGPKGKDVYPGHVVLACPAEFGISLGAGASLSTTASWEQEASYGSMKLAPRGHYTLVIGGVLRFNITLTGSSRGSLPTITTTTLPPSASPAIFPPGQAVPPRFQFCATLPNAVAPSGGGGSGQACTATPLPGLAPKLSPTPAPGCDHGQTATLISSGSMPPPGVACKPAGKAVTTPQQGQ
jgi:hypothetical protein